MKLIIKDRNGCDYYVFKPFVRRSDPSRESSRAAFLNGRKYSPERIELAAQAGLIVRPPLAPDYVLVAKNAPQVLGGNGQGMWKMLQGRLRLKHASSALDRRGNRDVRSIEQWFATQPGPGGVVETLPVLRGLIESNAPTASLPQQTADQRVASERVPGQSAGNAPETLLLGLLAVFIVLVWLTVPL
eukprot:m51a1_g289 putative C-tail anchored protein (187) ;mRNA; r:337415-338327